MRLVHITLLVGPRLKTSALLWDLLVGEVVGCCVDPRNYGPVGRDAVQTDASCGPNC